MQRICRATPVPKKYQLASGAQRRARFVSKRGDALDELRRKRLLHLCTFIELSSNFVCRGRHSQRRSDSITPGFQHEECRRSVRIKVKRLLAALRQIESSPTNHFADFSETLADANGISASSSTGVRASFFAK